MPRLSRYRRNPSARRAVSRASSVRSRERRRRLSAARDAASEEAGNRLQVPNEVLEQLMLHMDPTTLRAFTMSHRAAANAARAPSFWEQYNSSGRYAGPEELNQSSTSATPYYQRVRTAMNRRSRTRVYSAPGVFADAIAAMRDAYLALPDNVRQGTDVLGVAVRFFCQSRPLRLGGIVDWQHMVEMDHGNVERTFNVQPRVCADANSFYLDCFVNYKPLYGFSSESTAPVPSKAAMEAEISQKMRAMLA